MTVYEKEQQELAALIEKTKQQLQQPPAAEQTKVEKKPEETAEIWTLLDTGDPTPEEEQQWAAEDKQKQQEQRQQLEAAVAGCTQLDPYLDRVRNLQADPAKRYHAAKVIHDGLLLLAAVPAVKQVCRVRLLTADQPWSRYSERFRDFLTGLPTYVTVLDLLHGLSAASEMNTPVWPAILNDITQSSVIGAAESHAVGRLAAAWGIGSYEERSSAAATIRHLQELRSTKLAS